MEEEDVVEDAAVGGRGAQTRKDVAILACAAPVSAAAAVAVDAAADADTITTSMSDSVGPVDNSDGTAATVVVDDAAAADDDDGRSADGAKSTATPVTEASASRETIGCCC